MRYWKRLYPDGSTRTVESYSHNLKVEGAIEIIRDEFDNFIASLPEPIIKPVRDLATDVDKLTARIETLEKK